MEVPKPTPGHVKLEKFVGDWEGQETLHPSQREPKGRTTIGRMKNRFALNGFALLSDHEHERDGAIAFTGHGVWSFDPKSDLYMFHWFDSIGSAPEVFAGCFDGDRLTVAHGGPGMHTRLTYDLADPILVLSKTEMSQDGVTWNTIVECRYKRA